MRSLINRILYRLACRDRHDRFKRAILLVAGRGRSPRSDSSDVPGSVRKIESAVQLIRYTFPGWEDSIGLAGDDAQDLRKALMEAGFRRSVVCRLSAAGLESPLNCSRLMINGLLDKESRDSIEAALNHLCSSPHDWVVLSVPTYPDCLREPAMIGPETRLLERRDWWDCRLRDMNYEAVSPPREKLAGLNPLVYRSLGKASKASTTASQPSEKVRPKVIFVIPETQNAFRWAVESLAESLSAEGAPSAIVGPQEAVGLPEALPKITWAHYWPALRNTRVSGDRYEIFVTNFQLKSRGTLTPWLAELRDRPTQKLVPASFCKNVLAGIGVPDSAIHVIPHGYSPEFVDPPQALPLATRKSFRFLAVVNSWDPHRYGCDLLLKAYRMAFRAEDDVCLVLKDYGSGGGLKDTGAETGPEILYYANLLSKKELAAFYRACNCLVAPFRGEGFGMKILDAAVIGLPLVVPLFGGPEDYCPSQLVYPVAHKLTPVGPCLERKEIEWQEDLTWCEPDVEDLAKQMRYVFEHRDEAREKADQLRPVIVEEFSWRAAARKLRHLLEA